MFKKIVIILFCLTFNVSHGMCGPFPDSEGEELPSWKGDSWDDESNAMKPTFKGAIGLADLGGGIDQLKLSVEAGVDLNEFVEYRDEYPLACLVKGRYDSSLVTTAVCNGANVSLKNNEGRTLFHAIAITLKSRRPQEAAYFPMKNLLSAIALSSFQYSNMSLLDDDIYSQPLLAHAVEQKLNIKQFVASCPIEWFQQIVENRIDDDREKIVKKFAKLIARYRLERAREIVLFKDNCKQTAYDDASSIIEYCKTSGEQMYSPEVIQDAQEMMDALNPEGFVDRHRPKCTAIIANVLQKKDPFDGFPEWQVLPVIPAKQIGNVYQE